MPWSVADRYNRRGFPRGPRIIRSAQSAGWAGRGVRNPLIHLMNRGGWVLMWLYLTALCFPRITPVKPSYFQHGVIPDVNGTANNSSTGNVSANVVCKKASPCMLCSMDEESKDYCLGTGYREEVRCEPTLQVETKERDGDGDIDRDEHEAADLDPETDAIHKPADKSLEPSSGAKNETGTEAGDDAKGAVDREDAKNEGPRKRRRRRILAVDEVRRVGVEEHQVFRSCIPFGDEVDKISVWAFEGIMLATFAVAAPVVRYRRGRSSAPAGMTRLPGSVWF